MGRLMGGKESIVGMLGWDSVQTEEIKGREDGVDELVMSLCW